MFRGKLIKVRADSTDKQFFVLIFLLFILLLTSLNFVSNYIVPQVFLDLTGLEDCPHNFNTFRGFCHHLKFNNGNKWEAYIGGVNKNNQVVWISGEIQLEQQMEQDSINFELQFNSRLSYMNQQNKQLIGEVHSFQSHKVNVQCFKGQRLCYGNDILSIFPEQNNQVLKIEL